MSWGRRIRDHIAEHAVLGVDTPSGAAASPSIRRDVLASRGLASDHPSEFFAEDRTGAGKGDQLWWSWHDGGTDWDWLRVSGRD